MKELEYLKLITETYFETDFSDNDYIQEQEEERKKLFRQILIRNQKVAQVERYITKEEFSTQCQKAVNKLQLFCKKETLLKREKSTSQETINKIDSGFYLIDMSNLIPEYVSNNNSIWVFLCNNDCKFIAECFENFSFDESEKFGLKLDYLPECQLINFINNFDNIEESTVFNYFKINLVDKKYLSADDLDLFLELAFDKLEMPQQKIRFKRTNTQKAIVKIFYNYYKTVAGTPYGKQEKYLNLLRDYFFGFDKLDIRNFSK